MGKDYQSFQKRRTTDEPASPSLTVNGRSLADLQSPQPSPYQLEWWATRLSLVLASVTALVSVTEWAAATSPGSDLLPEVSRPDTRVELPDTTKGSGAFAGGSSTSKVDSFSSNQGYNHNSGFSASDSKSFGSGHKQGSSGFQGGAAGHQAGFGQSSFGKAGGVGLGGVGVHG
ncbi:hypothetical protein HPB48_011058 [Haemaphysalis longicornis]|uniref:Uncharacterized protein n=1 Tax=Haemaphysalis longicornis TaxID=44386 RepID=A0A9J6FA85_HAELO|nr:hypothetical protein HPB48_011058 [Haemaphysalis longicornis]